MGTLSLTSLTRCIPSASIKVDFPAPGGPAIPSLKLPSFCVWDDFIADFRLSSSFSRRRFKTISNSSRALWCKSELNGISVIWERRQVIARERVHFMKIHTKKHTHRWRCSRFRDSTNVIERLNVGRLPLIISSAIVSMGAKTGFTLEGLAVILGFTEKCMLRKGKVATRIWMNFSARARTHTHTFCYIESEWIRPTFEGTDGQSLHALFTFHVGRRRFGGRRSQLLDSRNEVRP